MQSFNAGLTRGCSRDRSLMTRPQVFCVAIMAMQMLLTDAAQAGAGRILPPPVKTGVNGTALYNAGAAGVEIVDFSPAAGTFRRGEMAVSCLRVKNAGTTEREVWVGYSVRDAAGVWHDAECTGPVNIAAGAVSGAVGIAWTVPAEKKFTGGHFTARMAVWSARPGTPGAERLAMAEKPFAFYAANKPVEKKIRISGTAFRAVPEKARPQGNRGLLVRANAEAARDGGAEIKHRPGSFDGGELESVESFSYGTFSASIISGAPVVRAMADRQAASGRQSAAGRSFASPQPSDPKASPGQSSAMRASSGPGSSRVPEPYAGAKCVTGFFLYDPATEDEVTVEIFNDGSRRAWFSAFCAGTQTAHFPAVLDFDPAGGFHDYAIVYSPGKAVFTVDSKVMCALPRDGEKVPSSGRMKVFFNSWFPSWKEFRPLAEGDAPVTDITTHVRDFKFSPWASAGGTDDK